jgi:hypothetical protein
MKPDLYVFNDLHLGAIRTGGTTIASAAALRKWGLENFEHLLNEVPDNASVLLNGDVFDTFSIALSDVIDFMFIVTEAIKRKGLKLFIAYGNHDLSKDSAKLSSLQFASALLLSMHSCNVKIVDSPMMLPGELPAPAYVIPHRANQEIFDLNLQRVPVVDAPRKYLFLHCNYDNGFAAQQDHSLNLSREVARDLIRDGWTIVLAHEHQSRKAFGGSLIVTGNQWPTSVADCLSHDGAQEDGNKRYLVIDEDGQSFLPSWEHDSPKGFRQIKWDEIQPADADFEGFIRVEGEAKSEQSGDVIKAIAAFRQRSKAFVVTNAVKIEGIADVEDLGVSLEDMKSVDVIALLLDQLDPAQADKVREVLNKSKQSKEVEA